MKIVAEFVDLRGKKPVRYFPGEGYKIDPPLDGEQVERLKKAGCLADGEDKKPAVDRAEAAKPKDDGDDKLDSMKVVDLRALAELNNVAIEGDANKAAIVAALRAANVKG